MAAASSSVVFTCVALVETVGRRNRYDGCEEFWVVVSESGKREETSTYEEIHEKESKANHVLNGFVSD